MAGRAIGKSTIFKHENVPRQYQEILHECDQVPGVLNSMTPLLNDIVILNRLESKADLGVFSMKVGTTTTHTGGTMLGKPTGDELID